jgi:hypothetical protein
VAEVSITFTAKEIEAILLEHVVVRLGVPGSNHRVSFNIQKGSHDPRESSFDQVTGATVRFQPR